MIQMDRAAFFRHTGSSRLPVLVLFHSSRCFYCRRLLAILDRVSRQHPDSLRVGLVDADAEPWLCREEQIEALPTLVLYLGGEILGSLISPNSRQDIEELIKAEKLQTSGEKCDIIPVQTTSTHPL